MTKEEITIPRWLLERIEDTLRIQYNINIDKTTGETCQDRNIKESLNGIRKLLRGEELTGGERLERLQPPLPSNLDEAAEEVRMPLSYGSLEVDCYGGSEPVYSQEQMRGMFKTGAEWATNELFENNRLKDCEALSEEDYKLESDFVDAHIKKNHRLPTFLDAIKYGAKWMAWQGETFNGFMSVSGKRSLIAIEGSSQNFKFGENVIVQIRKKQ